MKNIKVGVFGAARGVDIAKNMMLLDCEIVALCDFNEKRRNEGLEKLGMDVEVFSDFDEFIKTKMDAVIIANYFHEHAPFKHSPLICFCLKPSLFLAICNLLSKLYRTILELCSVAFQDFLPCKIPNI